ncbi:metallophosphoesterase [Massilia yuzhufengensis]|uniref:Calcineurin-like phosphoesterase n=1 Tax=Massilia yuzhufengensis TaxID=1164594 RepID=A0A1I1WRG6_9BURK|nr:metallophosphoesterase [Massilia yuzhufengensis]SFD97785.1 Calcineurin-like phosphoesterase [Massilia yuzhufengensis]
MKKTRAYLLRGLAITASLLVVAVGIALANADIELTESGSHKRLLVPIGVATAGIHTYAGTGDAVRIPGFLDGPIVRKHADGSWAATWFCEDKVHHLSGRSADLSIDCAGKRQMFQVSRVPTVPNSVFDTPADTLIISDIEGNARFLDAALKSLQVTDDQGNWRYGVNHLVIAGDAVDRGRDVFAVLWRLYTLSLQAQEAGGAVHLVLGNHEQYLLRGNTSRANRDHLYALNRMGGQPQAFGPDTLIGRWLRLQPVVIKSGRTVITHGGVSPVVADSGFTVNNMNSAMRRYWSGDMPTKAELDSVIGPAGVTQYRGYFQAGEDRYAQATPGQIGDVLAHFGANTIIVGHTLVDGVTALHGGKVWAVDVNSNTARPEALLIRNGEPVVVSTGVARQLEEDSKRRLTRPLSLFDPADLAMLKGLFTSNYALSQIPQPY